MTSKAFDNVVKLNGITNIKEFGARGDGAADDTGALIAALAAMQLTGGTLYFPPGTYILTNGIPVTNNNITLSGAGPSSVIQTNTTNGTNTYMFEFSGSNVCVENLKLRRGTNTTNAGTALGVAHMIGLANTLTNWQLRDCYIDGNMTGQITRPGFYYTEVMAKGEIATHPRGLSIINNYWTDTGSRAIDIRCVQDVVIAENLFRDCGVNEPSGNPGTCVEVQSYDATNTLRPSNNVTIANNVFQRWGDGAINCGGTLDLTITGNVCQGASVFGVEPLGIQENCIAILGGERTVISNNTCTLVRSAGILIRTQIVTGTVIKNLYDMVVSNNTLVGGLAPSGAVCETALQVYGLNSGAFARNIVVANNALRTTNIALLSNTGSGLTNVAITGNSVVGTTTASGSCISISNSTATISNLTITGNQLTNAQFGIDAPALPASTIITGNGFGTCVTPINDNGLAATVVAPGYLSAGATPANSGQVRLPNTGGIKFRNAAGNADIEALSVDASNDITIGAYLRVNNANTTVSVSSAAKLLLSMASQTISAGGTITPSGSTIRVTGDGGAVTCGATAISNGAGSGQILILVGNSDTNTVTLTDGNNVVLGGASRVLGQNDTLALVYIAAQGWCEIAFSNN